jgi:hypothetical protein
VKTLIEYIDLELLRHKLTEEEYRDALDDLIEYLEENL